MQAQQTTLKSIFEDARVFNNPIYKRAYNWQLSHWNAYLMDLITQNPNHPYFYGTFVLQKKGQLNAFEIYDIVKGQQRLTTFLIFINELCKQLKTKSALNITNPTQRTFIKDETVFTLEFAGENNIFLHDYIFSDQPLENVTIATPSQHSLVEAKRFFKTSLAAYNVELLEGLYKTAIASEAFTYVLDEHENFNTMFDLLNRRGLPLSDLEAIKFYLMQSIARVAINPNQHIVKIQDYFTSIYRLVKTHDLSEDVILSYHNLAFDHGTITKSSVYIKHEISELIQKHKLNEAKAFIMNYCKKLKATFKTYVKIQKAIETHQTLQEFIMLGKVTPFYPLLINIKKNHPDRFDELLIDLNKFVFRTSLIHLQNPAVRYINMRLRYNEDAIGLVKELISRNCWNMNTRVKTSLEDNNHYEGLNHNTLRYILFIYENTLREIKGVPKLTHNDYLKKINHGWWFLGVGSVTVLKCEGKAFDADFQENYVFNIGNLVLDYVPPSISKWDSDEDAKIKREAYKQVPLLSQNSIDEADCDWNNLEAIKLFINQRKIMLKAFIIESFEID